ncbi:MAG: hypothetical protein JO001_10900 [Alphaproteobacteria bacterium]|nr:hypothetical protein [Alphaproteobacteria bacterium]
MFRFVLLFAVAMGLAGSPASAASEVAANPNIARVWFLWPSDLAPSYDTGATPTIYVNGRPLAVIRGGTAFYRDFPAGTYGLSIDAYGTETGQVETVRLMPGTQTFLQVQYDRTWEHGYVGGRGMTAFSFFITPMSAQLAAAYLPTMTNLGPR